jgi:hypothetical protein
MDQKETSQGVNLASPHLKTVLRNRVTLMQIRILLDADPDLTFHSHADQDPTFQFDAGPTCKFDAGPDPDPDPTTYFFHI